MKAEDMVVTQNVDGFHQSAGSREVVELHGSEVHAICLNKACGRRLEMKDLFEDEKFWSEATAWGLRWPEGEEESELQPRGASGSELSKALKGCPKA